MKLTTKLKISFCVLIIAPAMLLTIAAISLGTYQLGVINDTYDVSGTSYQLLTNPIILFTELCDDSYKKLSEITKEDPDKLSDVAYVDELNADMKDSFSYIIVTRNNGCIYEGEKSGSGDLSSQLLSIKDYGKSEDAGMYFGGSLQVLVKPISFQFTNGDRGHVFVVIHIDKIVPKIKLLLIDAIIAIFLILVLTSGFFTVWVYKATVSPINKLKQATNNIKEGNLDFIIEADGKDEISELCRDFEEMRKRLKESSEEKIQYDMESKELVSNISHDLKTPITAVKGYVEGIMDGVADNDEKMDRYIRTIYNKAIEMDKLIDELTFYSKIDTNKIPYNFKKINVERYFEDCVEELSLDLESKGIDLGYFNYLDNNTYVVADAEQLKRVINNVVGNSVKYMNSEKKGLINIRINDDGDYVRIDIEDNGKGIPEKDIKYVFDRFFRSDASRNSLKGGSGIGLSIVKKIITDHGGSIWASSKEGVGTVMSFILKKYKEDNYNE